jgi:hypothetical protein
VDAEAQYVNSISSPFYSAGTRKAFVFGKEHQRGQRLSKVDNSHRIYSLGSVTSPLSPLNREVRQEIAAKADRDAKLTILPSLKQQAEELIKNGLLNDL